MVRKIFAIVLAVTLTVTVATAQSMVALQQTERLSGFTRVELDGQFNVVFKKVSSPADLKITYDTKGDMEARFRATVNKNGILQVSERSADKNRTRLTDVTICYMEISSLSIARANAKLEGILESDILDLTVTGGAVVNMELQCKDTNIECTGRSSLLLSGQSRYLTLKASSTKVDASALETMCSIVEATHTAEVKVFATERLEAVTSTSGVVSYKGSPSLRRLKTTLFGGEIMEIQ